MDPRYAPAVYVGNNKAKGPNMGVFLAGVGLLVAADLALVYQLHRQDKKQEETPNLMNTDVETDDSDSDS